MIRKFYGDVLYWIYKQGIQYYTTKKLESNCFQWKHKCLNCFLGIGNSCSKQTSLGRRCCCAERLPWIFTFSFKNSWLYRNRLYTKTLSNLYCSQLYRYVKRISCGGDHLFCSYRLILIKKDFLYRIWIINY